MERQTPIPDPAASGQESVHPPGEQKLVTNPLGEKLSRDVEKHRKQKGTLLKDFLGFSDMAEANSYTPEQRAVIREAVAAARRGFPALARSVEDQGAHHDDALETQAIRVAKVDDDDAAGDGVAKRLALLEAVVPLRPLDPALALSALDPLVEARAGRLFLVGDDEELTQEDLREILKPILESPGGSGSGGQTPRPMPSRPRVRPGEKELASQKAFDALSPEEQRALQRSWARGTSG